MMRTTEGATFYRFRLWPKDLGVALVVLVALAFGLLLFTQVTGRTRLFQAENPPLALALPANWVDVESLQDVVLKVEDPRTDSAFKTTLTVESRDLDPQNPPTLQELVDRRVELRAELIGYHFLENAAAAVAGEKAARIDYAYVAQPIDTPRRASLPVVVVAREYVVITAERSYYFTLAAPEHEFERVAGRFEQILATVRFD